MGLDFDSEHTGLVGADALIARLTALPGAAQQGAIQGMMALAEDQFMPHIKENDVPFYLGNLHSSGAVWLDESGTMVLIEFGTPGSGAEEYAVEQHERTDYNHQFGRAKYLEAPLQEWAERFIEAAREGVSNILQVTAGPWTRYSFVSKIADPGYLARFDKALAGVNVASPPKVVPKGAPRLVRKGAK